MIKTNKKEKQVSRGSLIRAELLNQPFIMCPAKMDTYINVLNTEIPRMEDKIGVANNNVVYTALGNVAVIAIDGAMYKKSMNGACGESVVAYPNIVAAIDKAENDMAIDTILFRVDTGGGSVAGAEEVRYRIKNSRKKTVTLYENLGASGGIWIFTASKEVYATPITHLGSIGVVVAYEEEDIETKAKKVELVSKNAPNKRCNLNGDCREKMQTMIDELEKDFFAVLEENTGFKMEQLVEIFENGGIIKAEVAKEKGFIKDIRHFSVLLETLKTTQGVARMENNNSSLIGGLAFNEDNFTMLVESRDKSKETIKALTAQVSDLNTQVENASKAAASLDGFKAQMKDRLSIAMSFDVRDLEVLSSVISAVSDSEATKVAIDYKSKNTVDISSEEQKTTSDKTGVLAYCKQNQGSIK
jgi:ClpP class serine protease